MTTSAAAAATLSSSPTTPRMAASMSRQPNDSSESIVSLNTQQAIQNIRLGREKNRLTLRAYLHSLMNSSVLASSPVLRHFLLSNQTKLSVDEQEDARRREDADRKRDEGRIHFAHEIAARVEGLRGAMRSVKGDIMAKGASHLFHLLNILHVIRWSESNIWDHSCNTKCS